MGTMNPPKGIDFLKGSTGFSLVEIMVSVGLTGILVATLTSIIGYMEKSKKQAELQQTLTSMQNKIQSLLNNDSSWDRTIGSPTNADPANVAVAALSCLPTGTNCTHINKPAPTSNPPLNEYYLAAPFIDMPVLAEPNGTRYLNNTVGTAGFTTRGAPCNTFDPLGGNDACPIRWELKLALTCPNAAATCNFPTVEIFGIPRFRPSLVDPQISSINDAKYRVIVTRGSRGANRSEQFEASYGATGAGSAGGACTLGSWSVITFDGLDRNENNNATLAGANVTVRPGTYNCSFAVTCFECGGLRARLSHPGGPTQAPASLATAGVLARSGLDNISFTALAASNLTLEMWAERLPTDHAITPQDERLYCRGMALPDYTARTKFAQLNCVRIY